MWWKYLAMVTGILVSAAVWADGHADPNPGIDNSKAGTDGPHVFYSGRRIVVKMVLRRDTGLIAKSLEYNDKKAITLTCNVPDAETSFSFQLQDKLSPQPTEYPMPEKMLVLSDIEGNFSGFKAMLLGAGVIDENLSWSFGQGHLVLLGDYFDRGLNVTECFWLVYKLETEAKQAGGQVHFILGNHEVLNLQGDFRYVRKKYMENAKMIGKDYQEWYTKDTELGRWLRTKNVIEKIGDYVFCHGGISPEFAALNISFDAVNRIARANLGVPYNDIKDKEAQAVFDGHTGPFWYRNAAKNLLSKEELDQVLRYADAKRMIVGHTLAPDVMSLCGGRVVVVDLYHDENYRQGFMKTLYIEDEVFYTLDNHGTTTSLFSLDCRK